MKARMLALPLTLLASLGLLAPLALLAACDSSPEIKVDNAKPSEVAAKMKEQMVKASNHESCLTPEQAKNPKEDFFAGVDKSCRYDHFEMDGGKIDAAMTCTHDKLVQKMTMAGSYSPERYDMSMTTMMEGGGAQSGTTMKMKVAARRTGDCDAADRKRG